MLPQIDPTRFLFLKLFRYLGDNPLPRYISAAFGVPVLMKLFGVVDGPSWYFFVALAIALISAGVVLDWRITLNRSRMPSSEGTNKTEALPSSGNTPTIPSLPNGAMPPAEDALEPISLPRPDDLL